MRHSTGHRLWAWSVAAACLAAASPTPGGPAAGTYAHEKALARKAGIAMTPAELAAALPAIPADRNAAPVYRLIDKELERAPLTAAQSDLLESKALNPAASAADQEAARKALREIQPLMDLVHRAAALPECRLGRDWSQGADMLFPGYARFRRVARLLSAEAMLLGAEGKVGPAVETGAMVLRVSHHVADDPVLIAHLVAVAVDAIGTKTLMCLLQSHPNAETARAVLAALRSAPPVPRIHRTMSGEVVTSAAALRKAGFPGSRPSAINDAMQACVLRTQRLAMAALRLPYPVAVKRLADITGPLKQRVARKDPSAVPAGIIAPVYAQAATTEARCRSRRAVLASGADAILAREAAGSFPAQLAGIRTDPFTGAPLVYRIEGAGFAVFSRGETGKYDGAPGKASAQESLFRLEPAAR